ncbi:MAG TPA: ATP-dependent DNA helicase RecG [Candidatus Paceibacterota bacterium]|nr:ATP-dependent DNA helicase RecG [Candidatus Paceibacterota bacterium]
MELHLRSKLSEHFRLSDVQKKGLRKLRLETVEDLLWYFPVRYGDTSKSESVRNLAKGEKVILFGKIKNLKTKKGFRSKVPMAKAVLEDETGKINIVWFNQPYIAKMIKEDSLVKATGVVSERNGSFYLSNPQIESVTALPQITGESLFGKGEEHSFYPVYNETKGVTSNWIYHTIQKIFKSGIHERILDYIPASTLKEYSLPSLQSALVWIHSPKNQDHATAARKRFSFEEVFLIQIIMQKERLINKKLRSLVLDHTEESVQNFISRFPFSLTKGQETAIKGILSDFKKGNPMARLLEGDVGSGKTAVAATAAFAVTENHPDRRDYGHFQTAYMAPTEILAEQHFKSFIELFEGLNVPIGLLTGSVCKKFPSKLNPKDGTHISKTQLLKWVQNGEISILIGTHALIQKAVKFKNLAFVIIDEQHRFGTEQRKKLARKDGLVPHLLSMSATPIPRTLALTMYGDLDLSILDQMPSGRKPIITEIVTPDKRKATYEKMREEMKEGRQAYVICPRIDEPDPDKVKALYAKSVKEEALRLKKSVFPEYQIGILHSKMTPKEKESIMMDFKNKKIDILVATSVVEVGVNVPNATLIVIEGAERFGLSQLHQLRGRVIRGTHQAYCFIFADSKSDKTIERLKAFKNAKDGFELAELDLKLRGAGELAGGKQWGISDIGMEAIQNLKMVEAARNEAREIVSKDLDLIDFPLLKEKIKTKRVFHFE